MEMDLARGAGVVSGISSQVNYIDSFDGLLQAFRIVYEQYYEGGYIPENQGRLHYCVQALLPTSVLLVNQRKAVVHGTGAIVRDTAIGLPSEREFGEEIDELRARGKKIAEAALFAFAREMKSHDYEHKAIIERSLETCLMLGVDDLLVVLSDREQKFWTLSLEGRGLELATVGSCANSARGHLMCIPLRDKKFVQTDKFLYRQRRLLEFSIPRFMARYLLSASDIIALMLRHAAPFESLSEENKRIFFETYPAIEQWLAPSKIPGERADSFEAQLFQPGKL